MQVKDTKRGEERWARNRAIREIERVESVFPFSRYIRGSPRVRDDGEIPVERTLKQEPSITRCGGFN